MISWRLPLPSTCRLRASKSTWSRSMSTDSDLRMPVPYSKAMIAASRTPCGRGSAAHTSISSRIRLRRRLRPGGRRLPVAGLTSRMRNNCS
ncbi:hypothetical protein D3C75_1017890 [compost metagenome]